MDKIKNIFPTPIYLDNIGRNFKKEELDFIKNLKILDNILNSRSKNSYVLDSLELKELSEFISNAVKTYFHEVYKPSKDVEIYITQSWVNVSDINESHHIHQHPNSFISGVLYIDADREVDKIQFSKTDYSTIKIIPTEYNLYNSSSWYFNVGTGDILLFPSTLYHYVEPVVESQKRKYRISLSFNTFLKGTIGDKTFLSELKL